MFPTLLTVLTAAVLGGAIAAGVTAVIVIAAATLVLIGLGNGVIRLADLCDRERD